MKIISANVPITLNVGYAYTHRRIFARLPHRTFFYGEYGSTYAGLRRFSQNIYTFGFNFKPHELPKEADFLFIHDDPQRLSFVRFVRVPRAVWLPLDHENPDPPEHAQIISLFDEVIPISKFTYESRDYWTRKWIYNPVETKLYRPMKIDRAKFGLKDDDFVALYVGNTGWRKRVSHILSATRILKDRIPNFKLILVSDLIGQGFNYNELIYGLGLEGTVFVPQKVSKLEPIPPQILAEIYNIADVYITPHGGEGMGLPIVEAMACSTPFVATDYTTTAEFAEDGKRGLGAKIGKFIIDRGIRRPYVDINDFVDKIVWLYENPDQRRKMGREGRKWAVENCDSDLIAKQLDKIFEEYAPLEGERIENYMGGKV